MSCIVGYIDRKSGIVYIGADSCCSNGKTKSTQNVDKAFHTYRNPNIVIGSTSSYRHINLLRYSNIFGGDIGEELTQEKIVCRVIPVVMNMFQNGVVTEPEEDRGANFLVGGCGKLFKVQSDYSVLEPDDGYAAVGCGEEVALGSLYATTEHGYYPPIEHIRIALEAAEKHCLGVQRPFIIVNTSSMESEVYE